jgi:hypothetical protein
VVDSQQTFWRWFDAHQDQFLDFEVDQERIFDELSEQLIRVHPRLSFEFGPKTEPREFVISASGIKEAFPAVTSLVAAAPQFNRWRITAFRPRRSPLCTVQIGETCVDPGDVEFSLLTNGTMIGIKLFMPRFREDDAILKQVAYLMLDEALGEYDVETKLGLIQMLPSESADSTQRYPLSELSTLFDQLASKLAAAPLAN